MKQQVLLGSILSFFLSPLTTAALRNFGAPLKNDLVRFSTLSIWPSFYTLAILLVLAAIPGPFLSFGRLLEQF